MIEINIRNVGVDAGMIMLCDDSYYDRFTKNIDHNNSKEIGVEPGVYDIEWSIKETWTGPISGKGIVNAPSGKIIVSDPCYCAQDWDMWLDETDFGNSCGFGVILIDEMGGDGDYNINLKMEKKQKEDNNEKRESD